MQHHVVWGRDVGSESSDCRRQLPVDAAPRRDNQRVASGYLQRVIEYGCSGYQNRDRAWRACHRAERK